MEMAGNDNIEDIKPAKRTVKQEARDCVEEVNLFSAMLLIITLLVSSHEIQRLIPLSIGIGLQIHNPPSR